MIHFIIGISGALGAICRYIISMLFISNMLFPFSTLIANLIGSFLFAWLMTALVNRYVIYQSLIKAVATGFIGSFTTFSTFSLETVELLKRNEIKLAVVYVLCSIIGGLLMSQLGFRMNKESE